jgi:hypothetical protein
LRSQAGTLKLSPDAMRTLGRSARIVEDASSFDPSLADELVAARKAYDSNQPANVARDTSSIGAH